jgi:nucleoside 2-deoxyribosyltransferase
MSFHVYFAGPLFTPYERGYIDDCAMKLRAAGMTVFVPHEQKIGEEAIPILKHWAAELQG